MQQNPAALEIPASRDKPGLPHGNGPGTGGTDAQAPFTTLNHADAAGRTAEGVATLAGSMAQAYGQCSDEQRCLREDEHISNLLTRSCTPIGVGDDVDTSKLLRPVLHMVETLETQAANCATLACPGADCEARSAVLEAAAFAQSLLIAATGDGPAAGHNTTLPQAVPGRIISDHADGAVQALLSLVQHMTLSGLDPEDIQRAARTLAEIEQALEATSTDDNAMRERWRATAARLALAHLRDRLGRFNMASGSMAETRPPQEDWSGLGDAMQRAVLALARLGAGSSETQQRPGACPASDALPDPAIASALARLRTVLNLSAVCSIRSGCGVQQALERGTARAALLLRVPVLEQRLEIMRALEEEVELAPHMLAAAAASAEPAPQIMVDFSAYRQGEAVKARVDANQNRCLAQGGTIVLRTVEQNDPAQMLEDVALPASKTSPVHFAAPAPGDYEIAVVASVGNGGGTLASVPVRVSGAEPSTCVGWNGVWQTEFGRLVTVTRDDGYFSGTYRQTPTARPGFVFGRVREETVEGIWLSEIATGGTRLRLMGEGVFRGGWGLSPGRTDNGGRWSGICVAQ